MSECSKNSFFFKSDNILSLDSVRDVKLIVLRLDESGNRLDWSDQLLTVKEQLDEVNHFILDIDLDFFSTLNPFVNLYNEANLYSQLKELYTFKPVPKDLGWYFFSFGKILGNSV